MIRWVYITEIVIYLQYFTLKLQKIFNSLQENFEKVVFVHLFPLYFLCVVLVSEKLVFKYEHLLILTDIAASTLFVNCTNCCIRTF